MTRRRTARTQRTVERLRDRLAPIHHTVTLPPPIGTIELEVSAGAVARFQDLTRAHGIGPHDPDGRATGVNLYEPDHWAWVDSEALPLMLCTFARYADQVKLEDLIEACGPWAITPALPGIKRFVTAAVVRLRGGELNHGTE